VDIFGPQQSERQNPVTQINHPSFVFFIRQEKIERNHEQSYPQYMYAKVWFRTISQNDDQYDQRDWIFSNCLGFQEFGFFLQGRQIASFLVFEPFPFAHANTIDKKQTEQKNPT
jgi:hypothetical protein